MPALQAGIPLVIGSLLCSDHNPPQRSTRLHLQLMIETLIFNCNLDAASEKREHKGYFYVVLPMGAVELSMQ